MKGHMHCCWLGRMVQFELALVRVWLLVMTLAALTIKGLGNVLSLCMYVVGHPVTFTALCLGPWNGMMDCQPAGHCP